MPPLRNRVADVASSTAGRARLLPVARTLQVVGHSEFSITGKHYRYVRFTPPQSVRALRVHWPRPYG